MMERVVVRTYEREMQDACVCGCVCVREREIGRESCEIENSPQRRNGCGSEPRAVVDEMSERIDHYGWSAVQRAARVLASRRS